MMHTREASGYQPNRARIYDVRNTKMKVALTGHTSGLGKCIFQRFSPDCLGFSRNNGFDIGDFDSRKRILDRCADTDVFINNAHSGFAQVALLYDLYDTWKHSDKLIINISSISSDGTASSVHPYSVNKSALDKASDQLSNLDNSCRICNIKPGWIDTPRVSAVTDRIKMRPDDVVDLIAYIVNLPRDLVIPSITVVPWRHRL